MGCGVCKDSSASVISNFECFKAIGEVPELLNYKVYEIQNPKLSRSLQPLQMTPRLIFGLENFFSIIRLVSVIIGSMFKDNCAFYMAILLSRFGYFTTVGNFATFV